MEASFTQAPDKDTGSTDGPLPQSQRQREQLMQLYQQISTSPNPQEMLQKVAEANNMSAEQLGDILMRNLRDMEMASGGPGNGRGMIDSLPRKMLRLLSTLVFMALKSASAHPKSAMMTTIALISILYVLISAPRNGIVISRSRGLLSSGPTTVIAPPISYLEKLVDSRKFEKSRSSMGSNLKAGSLTRLFESDESMGISKDGIHVVPLSKKQKKDFSFVIMATKKIPFEILLPSEEELELLHAKEKEKKQSKYLKSEDLMAKVEEDAWSESISLALQSAQNVVDSRRFSEFVSGSSDSFRFYSSRHDHDKALLVVKKMGDWKRFGIQPLRVAYEEDGKYSKSIIYYTLSGGHFDGEIKVSVQRIDDDSGDEPSVTVSVALLVPKNGRQMNKKMASEMVLNLAESITKSTMTSARQILSRRLQSTIYRGKAMNRASEKRTLAFDNMQKMEEMAAERKRRWARTNPNAGSYRPSGDMHRLQGRPSRSF
jgi:hypothetical protein